MIGTDGFITNAGRAELARIGLDAFSRIAYGGDASESEPLETRIRDLICDLLHLARREGGVTDIEGYVLTAVVNHNVECDEDEEG